MEKSLNLLHATYTKNPITMQLRQECEYFE